MMATIASARPVSLTMPHSSIDPPNPALVEQLAEASRAFDQTSLDPERNCWLAVHRHVHGVLPSEYDIREVPEDLYLAVLARRRGIEDTP
jgi:hypothetical protein